jgi:carbamoyltransferase
MKILPRTILTLRNLCSWFWKKVCLNLQTGCKRKHRKKTFALAGGVALNCVSNARIRDRGAFKNIWVQPASGDDGTALGAALWVDAQQRKNRRAKV